MKKGFTLIELLAVILILGIIALIAIPTVNKIINEAREGSFKTSVNNIIKSAEQKCQLSNIKGESAKKNFVFGIDKNKELDIKGELPQEGYISLDNNCKVIEYYLKKNNITYEENTKIKDYMIISYSDLGDTKQSIFKSLYPEQFSTIRTVNFIKSNETPENAINIQDLTKQKNGNVKSYILARGDEGYDLYITSENTIYANYDSSYLFNEMIKTTNYDFSNFNTSFSQKFRYFFANNQSLNSLNLNSFNTENIIDTEYMFYNCKVLLSLDLSNWNTTNLENPLGMFHSCNKLEFLDVSTWNLSNVITLEKMFWECKNLKELDLSKWKTSDKLTNLTHTFVRCTKLTTLNLSGFNTKNVTMMKATFTGSLLLKEIIGIENWDTSNLQNQYDGGVSGTFNSLESLESLNLSNWNTEKLSNFTYMFSGDAGLKSLDISNWTIDETDILNNIFKNCSSLVNISVSSAFTSNIIDDYLPIKSSSAPGTIVIKGDTKNLDTAALEAKYWYAVDSNGNPLHT